MIISRSVYRESNITTQAILMALGAAMIAVSLYLTDHYFAVKFPEGIMGAKTVCDINSFFNCDTATNSIASNIAGVPISIFGVLTGILVLIGFVFKSDDYEGTLYKVLMVNLLGCILLFLFSLIVLKSLCPFCTVYYILSAAVFGIFHKKGNVRMIAPIPALIFSVVAAAFFGGTYFNIQEKSEMNDKLKVSLINQFNNLPRLGKPATDSPYRIASSSEAFDGAPLQITMFSDYQCPACKALSDQAPLLAKRYEGKINIQYMFYPLDMNCNPNVQRGFHDLACKGAYLTVCLGPEKFGKVHDDIFHNQAALSIDWLNSYAKREGVLECMNSEETKQKVVDIINMATPFNIKSTPSMLVNGVKIEGVLPTNQMFMILDSIIEKAK